MLYSIIAAFGLSIFVGWYLLKWWLEKKARKELEDYQARFQKDFEAWKKEEFGP